MKRALGYLLERVGHLIEWSGTPLPSRDTLNFTGSGVSVADSGGKTVVTISGGGGSAWDFDEGTQAAVYGVGTVDLDEGIE